MRRIQGKLLFLVYFYSMLLNIRMDRKNWKNKVGRLSKDDLYWVEYDGLKFFDRKNQRKPKLGTFVNLRSFSQDPSHQNILSDILRRYEKIKTRLFSHTHFGKFYDIKKGDTIMELGAYKGYFAIKASKLVGAEGRVIAVEPVPKNLEIFRMNVDENQLDNISVFENAIWQESKEITFNTTENQRNSIRTDLLSDTQPITVQALSIDDLIRKSEISKLDFVRLQLNGVEFEALEGFRLVDQYRPKLMIATPYESSKNIEDWLKQNRYRYKMRYKCIEAYPLD